MDLLFIHHQTPYAVQKNKCIIQYVCLVFQYKYLNFLKFKQEKQNDLRY